MLDITAEQLIEVRDILARIVPGVPVFAYGSRVKGRSKQFSDLDLCLRSKRPLPALTMFELRDAFSESDLPFRVDISQWSELSDSFREIISSDCDLIVGE